MKKTVSGKMPTEKRSKWAVFQLLRVFREQRSLRLDVKTAVQKLAEMYEENYSEKVIRTALDQLAESELLRRDVQQHNRAVYSLIGGGFWDDTPMTEWDLFCVHLGTEFGAVLMNGSNASAQLRGLLTDHDEVAYRKFGAKIDDFFRTPFSMVSDVDEDQRMMMLDFIKNPFKPFDITTVYGDHLRYYVCFVTLRHNGLMVFMNSGNGEIRSLFLSEIVSAEMVENALAMTPDRFTNHRLYSMNQGGFEGDVLVGYGNICLEMHASVAQGLFFSRPKSEGYVLEQVGTQGWVRVSYEEDIRTELVDTLAGAGSKVRILEPDVLRNLVSAKIRENYQSLEDGF